MKRWTPLLTLAITTSVLAAEPSAREIAALKADLMIHTMIVAVTTLSVPASEFKGDGNPSTLEIVFLENEKDGPSRVTDDGEVIFLYRPSDKEQERLIDRAFDIRAARKLRAS
jgi:hypothetical protein